jgi:UPF0716 protein FxsA
MSPFPILLFLFLAIPLVEIYFLIKIGGWIGALPTVLLVVVTAILGATLVRYQGFATLQRLQMTLGRGEMPAIEMLEGVILLVAAVLLLTPGFFTDVIGFACLFPPFRRALALWGLKRVMVAPPGHGPFGPSSGTGPGQRTIEGDFRREDDKDK